MRIVKDFMLVSAYGASHYKSLSELEKAARQMQQANIPYRMYKRVPETSRFRPIGGSVNEG